MWERKKLVTMGKTIEHTSLYETDLSDDENAESMLKMFVSLPAEVTTQGVPYIHTSFIDKLNRGRQSAPRKWRPPRHVNLKACQRYMKNSSNSFVLKTSREPLKRKIVYWPHYIRFKNV
jgi:hypothetical protein